MYTPDGKLINHSEVREMLNLVMPKTKQTVMEYIESIKKKDCCP